MLMLSPFAQQSFRLNMHAIDACRQKARQDILLTVLGCVLLARERHGTCRQKARQDVKTRCVCNDSDSIHDKRSDALSHVHTQQPLSHSSATLHFCVLRHNAKPLWRSSKQHPLKTCRAHVALVPQQPHSCLQAMRHEQRTQDK